MIIISDSILVIILKLESACCGAVVVSAPALVPLHGIGGALASQPRLP